jgi:deazaflavin-dependent oxidoreductase (nitroreductase family)
MSTRKETMPAWMREHIELYQTDPEKAHMRELSTRDGRPMGRLPTLLLTTKGRKSGQTVLTPLIYGKTGEGFAIIASNGGALTHPAWFLNLEAGPDVEIQVAAKHYRARARVAGPEERKKIWSEMAKVFPPYDEYQANAGGREIPVVVLEPRI